MIRTTFKALCLILGFLIGRAAQVEAQTIDQLCKVPKGCKPIYEGDYLSYFDTVRHVPSVVWYSSNSSQLKLDLPLQRKSNYPAVDELPMIPGNAYSKTGYDHGHLAPARDFKYEIKAYQASNAMANISPQHPCFNQRGWCYLETSIRNLVESHPRAQVFVGTGSHFIPGVETRDTICLKNGVTIAVPDQFYKVVWLHFPEASDDMLIAFLVDHLPVANEDIVAKQITVDSLEKITGIDFFDIMPNAWEREKESRLYPIPLDERSDCGSKTCLSVMKGRIDPHKRAEKRCRTAGR